MMILREQFPGRPFTRLVVVPLLNGGIWCPIGIHGYDCDKCEMCSYADFSHLFFAHNISDPLMNGSLFFEE